MSFWLWIVFGLPATIRSHTFEYFNARGNNVHRPKWDALPVKPIVIEYNEATPSYKLSGTVLPVSYSGNKPIAPQIFNNAKENGVYDHGHVLALSLGGPNKKENIVAEEIKNFNWSAEE